MSTYRQYHDALLQIVEALERETNEAERLRWTRDLLLAAQTELVRKRDAAAYDLVKKNTYASAEMLCGISRDKISNWVLKHRERTGAPAIKAQQQDFRNVRDLSRGGRFPSPPHGQVD